ncbi:MAG: hypothetical protein ACRCWI_02885 [Brevinema sp.]
MKTHKTQQAHAINPRKSFYRIVLQIFVWALIIAFVSTLGVMWDGTAGGFPIVLRSSKGRVDLSPQNFYMMEYTRLNDELQKNNPNVDPRILNRYIQNASLTNTENTFTRQLFYQDIGLSPSAKIFQEIQANTGLSSNFINFQYAENYYFNPVGILPILASPTVSDMYAISDLQKLNIAIEIITLNKTNFLYANLSEEEKSQHYLNNFEQWIDKIIIHEIKTPNRGQARKVSDLINKNGVELALEELASDSNFIIQKDKTLTASNFTYFNNILNTYKTNTLIASGPLYNQGDYYVVILSNITEFSQLPLNTQYEVGLDYLQQNYQKIAKHYDAEWNNTLTRFQEEISTNTSFSVIINNIAGAVNHNTQSFTLLNKTITDIFGQPVELPILTSSEILSSILNTPLSEISPLINPKSESDLYLSIRPLLRQYQQEENVDAIYNDPELFQTIFYYKNDTLKESLNSQILKKYYKIKTYPDVLSNLSGS